MTEPELAAVAEPLEQPAAFKFVAVDAEAMQKLITFVQTAPLPYGRDALLDAVLKSARPITLD